MFKIVNATESRNFYGWWIVFSCFVCQGFGMGMVGIYGLFLVPLATEFDSNMSTLGLGMSIYLLCMGGTAPLVGMVMKPGRIKGLMLAGVVLASASLAMIGRADSLSFIAFFIAAYAFTAAGFGILPNNILLVNWFDRLRGRAMAIAAIGVSVASFSLPPLTAWCITEYGWRTALGLISMLMAGVLLPVISLLVIERPIVIGQYVDGARPDQKPDQKKSLNVSATGDKKALLPSNKVLFRDKNFWLIGILFGVFYTTAITQAVHFIPFLISLDLSTQQASWVISALGISGMLGKIFSGTLSDIFRHRIMSLVLCLQLIPLLAWLSLSQQQSFGVFSFFCSALLGFAGGGMIPMHAFVNSYYFGAVAVGKVTGFHSPMLLPAGLFAAPLAGWVIDTSGSYGTVFLALAGVLGFSSIICLCVSKPKLETAP